MHSKIYQISTNLNGRKITGDEKFENNKYQIEKQEIQEVH